MIMARNTMACDIRNWLRCNMVSLRNRVSSQQNVGYRTLCHILFTQPIAMQRSKTYLIRQAISNLSTGIGKGRHGVGAGEGLNLSSRHIHDTFRQGVPPVPVPPVGGVSRRYDSSPSHQKSLNRFLAKSISRGAVTEVIQGESAGRIGSRFRRISESAQPATSPGD